MRQNAQMSTLSPVQTSTIACKCGCGRTYPLYTGMVGYGSESEVAFRAAHFSHPAQTKHLWLLLGSGPWFADDERGCWLILDSWINNSDLIARVEDRDRSPFQSEDIFHERFLTRSEVMTQEGAVDWEIERRDDLLREHEETRRFILAEPEAGTKD
jgi:hypothetical protein